jgi:CRP/FNR family transcriptional regulator, cyclic AMP receptor protein
MVEPDVLKNILFLGELPDPVIEEIAVLATVQTYEKGAVIFRQEQKNFHLHLLISGEVHLAMYDASENLTVLDKINAGQAFGVASLLENEALSVYTAVCASDCRIIAIPGEELRRVFEKDFRLGRMMMLKTAQLYKTRIDLHTRQFLLSLSTHPEIG